MVNLIPEFLHNGVNTVPHIAKKYLNSRHTHKTRRQPNLKFFCERNKAWERAVKVIGQQSKFFQQKKMMRIVAKDRPRQDSNLQSSDPKSDALSIRPRGPLYE